MAQMPSAAPNASVIYDGVGPAPQRYGPQEEAQGPYGPRPGYAGGPGGPGGPGGYHPSSCGPGCGQPCGPYCGDGCSDCYSGGYCGDSCGGYDGGYGGYHGCDDGMWGDCGPGYAAGPCLSWYVDWLYLRASDADVTHAQQQNGLGGAGTVPFGDIGSVETDYDCGVRTGVCIPCAPSSSILLSYTFYETDGFNGVVAPNIPGGGGAVGSLVHHPNTALTASAGPVFATYDIDFQLADMLYRSSISCGPRHSLNYLIGFQYGNLEQNFSQSGIFGGGLGGDIDTFTTIDFDGGGLKAGFDVDHCLQSGFSAYGRLTGAVMAGQFGTHYLMRNATTTVELAHADWKDDRIVTHLEYEVGLGWTCPSGHWRFSSGYMFSHWMNIVTTPELIDAVQADNYTDVDGTLSFDGFITRVECCW